MKRLETLGWDWWRMRIEIRKTAWVYSHRRKPVVLATVNYRAVKRRQKYLHLKSENIMSTFTKFSYHIVFSTKHRRRLIHETFSSRLYEYIGGIIRAQKGHLIEIGGYRRSRSFTHTFAPQLKPFLTLSEILKLIHPNGLTRHFHLINLNGKKVMGHLLWAILK